MDLRPRFRRRDGYVLLVETDDSRRVVTVNEAAAKARRDSEPCPPPVEVTPARVSRADVSVVPGECRRLLGLSRSCIHVGNVGQVAAST